MVTHCAGGRKYGQTRGGHVKVRIPLGLRTLMERHTCSTSVQIGVCKHSWVCVHPPCENWSILGLLHTCLICVRVWAWICFWRSFFSLLLSLGAGASLEGCSLFEESWRKAGNLDWPWGWLHSSCPISGPASGSHLLPVGNGATLLSIPSYQHESWRDITQAPNSYQF